jgi:glycosyltransferase involved in cell wall biosynthesis
MTSVLFVNQHYYPDVASTGQHLTDLAEYLAADGFDVEVLASRGKYLAGHMGVRDAETRNGVAIRRVRTTSFGRNTHLGRLIDYASFYLRVLFALMFSRRRDGVVFLTTPPLLGFLGAVARRVRGQRYGIWSMDLHPDAEIASGMLRSGSLTAKLLSWMNAVGYRNADFVVDLGAYMKQRITAMGVRSESTATIHVWSRKDEILPTPREQNPLVDSLGLGGRFVVMYSGNAGIVHDFRDTLEAMRLLKDDPRIFFLFVGDGPRRREIETFAETHRLSNFAYRAYFSREELRYSLSVADVHLISLRAPFVGISVPGKLYGIMASARPALFIGPRRSESAETILEAKCGAVIDPETGDGVGSASERIVRQLQSWAADPAALRSLGANGRAAFEARYEREPNCEAFANVLRRAWAAAPTEDEEVASARVASVGA